MALGNSPPPLRQRNASYLGSHRAAVKDDWRLNQGDVVNYLAISLATED